MTRVLAATATLWCLVGTLTPSAVLLAVAVVATTGLIIYAVTRLPALADSGSVHSEPPAASGPIPFIRLADPSAPGHPRPRAPTALPAA